MIWISHQLHQQDCEQAHRGEAARQRQRVRDDDVREEEHKAHDHARDDQQVADGDIHQPQQVGTQAQGKAINHLQDIGAAQVQPQQGKPHSRQDGSERPFEELFATCVDAINNGIGKILY